jgi:hypothetical protein
VSKVTRLGIAVTVLAGLIAAAPALAADMAPVYKAPPLVPAPSYNWTGFYVGANVGGSWGRDNTDLTLALPTRGGGATESSIGSMSPAMNGVLGAFRPDTTGSRVSGCWVSRPISRPLANVASRG